MKNNLILKANDVILLSSHIQGLVMKVSDLHFKLLDLYNEEEINFPTDEPLFL